MYDLPDGSVLIDTDNGLFRLDPTGGHLTPTGALTGGRVLALHELPGGAVLIQAINRLYRFDPADGHVVPAVDKTMGLVLAVHDLPGGAVLIRTDSGIFRFDPAAKHVIQADELETTGTVLVTHSLSDGTVLIWAEKGWFRFDQAAGHMVPVNDVGIDTGESMYTLPNGLAIVRLGSHWHRGGIDLPRVLPLDNVFDIHDQPHGGVLIRADQGWFRFDPAARQIVSAGKADTGHVLDMHDLPGGAVLIRADKGFFWFDPVIKHVMPVPAGETATGKVFDMHDLPGGAVLIGADNGLFIVPAAALVDAEVKFDSNLRKLSLGPNWVEVRITLSHPCAAATGNMDLILSATLDGTDHGAVAVRRLLDVPTSANSATLAAPMVFNKSGKWSLQLRQGPTPIGQPQSLSLPGRSFAEILKSLWETALAVSAVLYALSFGGLLFLARRHAWAFRVLSDSVWAKVLTWPFFFLRHAPVVQQWVLEPWFHTIRRSTQLDARFLDPPISNGQDVQIGGTALLHRLRDTPRIWFKG